MKKKMMILCRTRMTMRMVIRMMRMMSETRMMTMMKNYIDHDDKDDHEHAEDKG